MKDWIDEFFDELEKGWDNYKRPKDYRERVLRVMNRPRKEVRNQEDGRAKNRRGYHD